MASASLQGIQQSQEDQGPRRQRGLACFVADFDNLANDSDTNPDQPQALVDVLGLARILRAEGVTKGTVVRNRTFSAIADAVWKQAGFDTKSCHRNVDDDVIEVARAYAQDPALRTLVLLGTDGIYTRLVTELQARGIRVLVWGVKRKFSRRLKEQATNIRYLDKWISSSSPSRVRRLHPSFARQSLRMAA